MIDLVAKIICNDIRCHITDDFKYSGSDEWEYETYESARYVGWQCIADIDYCPNHWHVHCMNCTDWQVGTRRTLEWYGWTQLRNDSEDALCPKCSKQMKGTEK